MLGIGNDLEMLLNAHQENTTSGSEEWARVEGHLAGIHDPERHWSDVDAREVSPMFSPFRRLREFLRRDTRAA